MHRQRTAASRHEISSSRVCTGVHPLSGDRQKGGVAGQSGVRTLRPVKTEDDDLPEQDAGAEGHYHPGRHKGGRMKRMLALGLGAAAVALLAGIWLLTGGHNPPDPAVCDGLHRLSDQTSVTDYELASANCASVPTVPAGRP